MSTPNTQIPYVPEGALDPAAGLNLSLNVIDALLQTEVISMSMTSPPGSPADGDLYVPAIPASGAWAGQENNLARFVEEGGFWQFYVAGAQVRSIINAAHACAYRWTGSSWVPLTPSLSAMGNHIDDAAAALAGVPVGGMYRNGSNLMIRVA